MEYTLTEKQVHNILIKGYRISRDEAEKRLVDYILTQVTEKGAR